jgi:hypothetical protein
MQIWLEWFPAHSISLHICSLALKPLHLDTETVELIASCLHQLAPELREVNVA